MPGDCTDCRGCDSDFTAAEYINPQGYSAVQCPTCEKEILTDRSAPRKKISCDNCGTVIEVVPVLLN
ncbi:MAG: hypothetical protein ACOY46_07535 [Bacillota bacterium]